MDLDRMTDEQLGRVMRLALRGSIHDRLVAVKHDIADVRADQEAERNRRYNEDRKKRHLLVSKGFSAGGVIIPLLDVRDVILDEIAPANVRSPYNRARFRLGMKELLDPETTTWRALFIEHIALRARIAGKGNLAVDIDGEDMAAPTQKQEARR